MNDGKKLLVVPNLHVTFQQLDKDQKGFLNEEECELFKQVLVREHKFDSDRLSKVFADLRTTNKKIAWEAMEAALNSLQPNRERFKSASPQRYQRGLDCFGVSTAEQMIPAARVIYVLQLIKKKFDLERGLMADVDWCIDQIASGNLYDVQPLTSNQAQGALDLKKSPALPWLAQFSTPKLDMEEIETFLRKTAEAAPVSKEAEALKERARMQRRSVVAKDLAAEVGKVSAFLNTVNDVGFDVLAAEQVLGRDKVLPLVAFRVFQEHDIFGKTEIDENAFVAFVSQITKGYVKDNPYHNDIHAADVLQMCHYMLSAGGVQRIAKLAPLDVAALLLSAIIHDYKHPGVTNGFLINSGNDLAVAYNDKSVLESYHVSEAFKLMSKDKNCDLFKNLTNNERLLMRKRIISCVLATDMAQHNGMMLKLHNLIITHGIHRGKNNARIISPKEEFECKQFVLDLCLHVSDCGNPCRDFPVYKGLVIRLMEEFGRQGDIEKGLKLPVSFLCDRATINVPSSQIGYISGITKPMISMFVEIFPATMVFIDNLLKNEQEWRKGGKS